MIPFQLQRVSSMPSPVRPQVHPQPRAVRSDGLVTRGQILQAAGELFAAKGFERTTSREICAAAGANLAAVNYHFGGKDALYDAVLVEAHGQLVGLDDLEAIRRCGQPLPEQLRALIALFVGRSARPAPWGLRVLVHELMAPSEHVPALIRQAVLPKVRVIKGLVGELLELPQDHPGVQRALALVVLPCVMLVIAPREVLRQVLPTLAAPPDELVRDMTDYALAGLASIARRHRGDRLAPHD